MQYKKLDRQQRALKRWHDRRNYLVSELCVKNPSWTRVKAFAEANRILRASGKVLGFNPTNQEKKRIRNGKPMHSDSRKIPIWKQNELLERHHRDT